MSFGDKIRRSFSPRGSPKLPRRPEIPQCYLSVEDEEVDCMIQNFDDENVFGELETRLRDHSTQNFVLDFGEDEAWCGFDFKAETLKKLLKVERTPELNTRWINIFRPSTQKEALKALAQHYDFSPRLLGLMCSVPPPPTRESTSNLNNSSILRRRLQRHREQTKSGSESYDSSNGAGGEKVSNRSSDLEESFGTGNSLPPNADFGRDLNHYTLVDDVWHWSSVDWGRQYICLGYNSIYNVDTRPTKITEGYGGQQNLPGGIRAWTWLLICEDATVLSITEDTFPHQESLNQKEQQTLNIVRRNMLNVFRQLSMAHDSSKDSAMEQLPIRKRVGDSEEETAHRSTDAPGLLLYCLFDDWYTTYSLVAKREHRFAAELNSLRDEMLITAELDHVDRLHHIGRQLAVLKRLYQCYDLLIDRLLEKQEPTIASMKNSNVIASGACDDHSVSGSKPQVHEMSSLLGVALSSAARARFERLKFRIRLYALAEIQECLDQKESLVMMNFNLIAIKESYSVERLTRVTLLLAKVTILFMPISLSTAYFSVQFKDVGFTVTQYWVSFVVILGVTLVLLMGFGMISGTMEGQMIYKPLSRKVLEGYQHMRSRRRRGRGG